MQIIKEFKRNNKNILPIIPFYDFPKTAKLLLPLVDRLAVRIPIPEDIDGPSYTNIFETIKDFKRGNNILIDVILDLNIITEKNEANRQFRELKYILEEFFIPETFYESIIISSTSFPENLSSISAGEKAVFNRYDIKLFNKILEMPMFKNLKNKLIYSDYGVTKFTDTELDFSKMRYGPLPKVKYTTMDQYIVLKGKRNNNTKKMVKVIENWQMKFMSPNITLEKNFLLVI
ncbi:hypothetical protein FQB35_15555 (plasmid) [Crassaminicella thermophila]|uniref:Uncharacterized protein n=1 Tax=Crassaminicella thermophila TaxID=2599308 RepID=A0A5C0SHS5_CRATE|nr:hypothetical protein [Crassaminicella thermophila]QEK13740.1 hypothetical protein FQB35_15555 [Crassaminicella thermophila]